MWFTAPSDICKYRPNVSPDMNWSSFFCAETVKVSNISPPTAEWRFKMYYFSVAQVLGLQFTFEL